MHLDVSREAGSHWCLVDLSDVGNDRIRPPGLPGSCAGPSLLFLHIEMAGSFFEDAVMMRVPRDMSSSSPLTTT